MRARTSCKDDLLVGAKLCVLIGDAYVNQEPIPRSVAGAATISADALDVVAACSYIHENATPRSLWRIGLEYELLGYEQHTSERINRARVQEVLRGFATRGGQPTLEASNIIALHMPYGDVTLEPGGQIEFSGFPERTLFDNEAALRRFLSDLRELGAQLGVYFIALGFDPLVKLEAQSWIKKQRYAIMRPYLRRRGGHAWDMMTRTAAMQVSIDYESEEDLGRKYVLGNRLGPIIAAMFANSPYADGAPTGLKSTRYAVWLDVDPDRTGPGAGSLDDHFDLPSTVAALLEVPAFFVARDGHLVDCAGLRLEDVDGARRNDFADLLSMIFTEARIREYVEMRSADSGHPKNLLSALALWKGLTYDERALREALELVPRLDPVAYRSLQMAVARDALATHCEGVNVLAIARDVVTIARKGLSRVAPSELHHLDVLAQNVEDGISPADILLKDFGDDVALAMQTLKVA